MFLLNPSRRHFLQTIATAFASLIVPRRFFARTTNRSFHFIETDTLNSRPVADPVAWALENRHQPILERAAEGLAKLTASDGERIIQLLVRRCRHEHKQRRCEARAALSGMEEVRCSEDGEAGHGNPPQPGRRRGSRRR